MKKMMYLFTSVIMVFFFAGCSNQEEGKPANEVNNSTEQSSQGKAEEVTFYVTRHGKTIFNTMHRVQGWSDTPLTEEGENIAEDLAQGLMSEKITFDLVYSSDSGRARETAFIVMDTLGISANELQESKQLRELHFGKYEGDYDENMWGPAAEKLGYEDQEAMMADLETLGLEKVTDTMASNDETGEFETFSAVRTRMQEELKQIAKKALESNQDSVLIVTHGMAISSLLSDLTTENINRQLPNASVSKIIYRDNQFVVESIGDTSYIEKGETIN